jgi:DNA (cytosine-5)-methyltransferase 1
MTLTVGSLFSGIGGLDLGLERAGMEVIWQSEIDPYGCRVLKKHWPEVVNHGNIKEINWGDVVRPDVICGGYPCQPFSTAGKRNGLDDPRHLWPWVREAISDLRPKYAILENVRGHLSLGGLSVIGELASIGYDAEWRIVSAASVGARHKRERIIIVAYPNNNGLSTTAVRASIGTPTNEQSSWQNNTTNLKRCSGLSKNVAYPNRVSMDDSDFNRSNTPPSRESPTVFSFARGSSYARTGEQWFSEPDVGRVANGIPSRVDRLRGLGNAVVPQVAELIGRMVMDYDTNL